MRPTVPVALLIVLALAGCSDDDDTHGGAAVEMGDDFFDPETMTVDAGTEMHFAVESSADNAHNVRIHMVGDPVTTYKKDENVGAGGDVHFTPATAGTYHVWCKYHGTMTSGMAMVLTVE